VKGEPYATHCFLSETKESRVLTIRVHSEKESLFSPGNWGMDPGQTKALMELLERKRGFVLFAGSEQEAIASNVRAVAKHLATLKNHVIVIEPYLESWLSGIEQFISKGSQKVFSRLLRAAFKHAPDVVVATPLEKKDHFDECLSESLKGRFVICHSFASDAIDALLQMAGLGVESYLVASALMGVVSKRTIRLNCPVCQTRDDSAPDRARELGFTDQQIQGDFFVSRGCESCHHTGYSGETDIFEVLVVTDEIRNLFSRRMKIEELRAAFRSLGFLTLRQIACRKALNGQISLTEVIHTTSK